MASRGRPRKFQMENTKPAISNVELVEMKNIDFDASLFTPHKTNTIIDGLLSSEGGIFPGTNMIVAGDPGVGKSTLLLDWISNFQKNGKKVLFVSGEMNEIDMFGYTKRYPKFGNLPILFTHKYSDNVRQALEHSFDEGYDVILIDSWAEINDLVQEENNWTRRKSESWLLDLMDNHNKAFNQAKKHTAFMCIQQMTKSGDFSGSNRIKHMTTSMAYVKFDGRGRDASRYVVFDKNRRGEVGQRMFFSLWRPEQVEYTYDTEG
jgi:DNA repair protein RadA/Sms